MHETWSGCPWRSKGSWLLERQVWSVLLQDWNIKITYQCVEKRKAHYHGPDIAVKLEWAQWCPNHVRAIKGQTALTVYSFTTLSHLVLWWLRLHFGLSHELIPASLPARPSHMQLQSTLSQLSGAGFERLSRPWANPASHLILVFKLFLARLVPSGPVNITGIWLEPDQTVTRCNQTTSHGHMKYSICRLSVWWLHKTDCYHTRPVITGPYLNYQFS